MVARSLRRREVSVLGGNWNQQLFPDDGMCLDTDLALSTTKSTTCLVHKTSRLAQAYLNTPLKFQQDLSLSDMTPSNLSAALTIWSTLPSGSISRIATKVRSAS